MKEMKLYECDFCGTRYREKTKCTECEKNHVKPNGIGYCEYVFPENNAKGYPVAIEILFKDGEILTYKRESEK